MALIPNNGQIQLFRSERMKYLLIIGFLIVSLFTNSQIIDSTIFNSEFEKVQITQYYHHNSYSGLKLLLTMDCSENNYSKYESFYIRIIKALEEKKIRKKKVKKQIKEIESFVSTNLLKSQDDNATFGKLLSSGVYNNYTLTGLYALIFTHFNINFEIWDHHFKVKILADPGAYNYAVFNNSSRGYEPIISDEVKRGILTFITDNNMISAKSINDLSSDQLIKKYYIQNRKISIPELQAYLYINRGHDLYNIGKREEAAKCEEKGSLLYPNIAFKYTLNVTLHNILINCFSNDNFSGYYLAKYANLNKNNEIVLKSLTDRFNRESYQMVVEKSQLHRYKAYYSEFTKWLSDTIDINPFAELYYHKVAYYYYVKNDFAQALTNLKLAYDANNNNLDRISFIKSVGRKHIFVNNAYESTLDSLKYYFEQFPFLKTDIDYQEYYVHCCSKVIINFYQSDNEKQGLPFVSHLDSILNNELIVHFTSWDIENAYLELSRYYIRKKNSKLALYHIDKASKWIPNSTVLSHQRTNASYRVNYEYNKQNITSSYEEVVTKDDFKNKFEKTFKGCWAATKGYTNQKESTLSKDEKLRIEIGSKNTIVYIVKGIEYKGKWSIREKSKLLYLVPNKNENDYMVYKIIEVNSKHILLKLYTRNKTNKTLILERCS
jgi:hypothetical protein